MISLIRIDDRLIHGQVACYWVTACKASTIVVANDRYAKNAMLKMTLSVGKPAGVQLKILTIQDAVSYLNKNLGGSVLLIVEGCKDALSLVSALDEKCPVNIGGIRFAPDQDKFPISNQVYLNRQELQDLKAISQHAETVYLQETPSKSRISLKEIDAIFQKAST